MLVSPRHSHVQMLQIRCIFAEPDGTIDMYDLLTMEDERAISTREEYDEEEVWKKSIPL